MAWYRWGETVVRAVQYNTWTGVWPFWFYRLQRTTREVRQHHWVLDVRVDHTIFTLHVGDWFLWAGPGRYLALSDGDFQDACRPIPADKVPADPLDVLTSGPVIGVDQATGAGLIVDENGRLQPRPVRHEGPRADSVYGRVADWLRATEPGNMSTRIEPRNVQVMSTARTQPQSGKPVKAPYVSPAEQPPRTLLF